MNSLPPGWTTRRPTLDDVPAILAVVQASNMVAIGEPDFSADDVVEAFAAPHTDPAEDCWLAVDPSGEVVGWAYPENTSGGEREFIEVYVHPERGLPAQRPLLELMLARVAVRAASFGHDPITVRAGAVPSESGWIEALTDAGFAFVKRYARMRGSLADATSTPPAPPSGVLIRAVRADDDAEMRRFHAVMQEAFRDSLDHHPVGYDDWRTRLDTLTSVAYDEWLVAEVAGVDGAESGAADREWAGVLQSSDQCLERQEAWVSALAVLRAHRRRGVGEALLRHAFAIYAAKGRAEVGLGVDLANPTRAVRLYTAVGLAPTFEVDMFERRIAADR